jgi:hypothetical protein
VKVLTSVLVLALMLSASENESSRQILNGRDLSGWKHVGPGEMTVENGLIRTNGGMGLLYFTGEKFGDCVIRIVYRMEHANDNSGVFIRIPEEPAEPWMPVNRGYEVQIDNSADDYHVTGVLYSLTRALARPGKPGPEWNTMEITLDGLRTAVTVNGMKVTDYADGQSVPPKEKSFEPDRGPRPSRGYIGLQNHSDKDVVYFKEVSVLPLNHKNKKE